MQFNNSYSELPSDFFERVNPTPVKKPKLIAFNKDLGKQLGVSEKNEKELAQLFSGNLIPQGSSPIAQAYAGHQYGNFVSQLGDGRAILLGELNSSDNVSYDVQLKGSGQTKFSRQGDGRSPLGPVIREHLVSEAMHHLNIPTTRSLAAVTTGEKVFRENFLPGGILCRVAKSHLRVGTFEYFIARGDIENLKILSDYAIERLFPSLKKSSNIYLSLLESVCQRQIELVSKWMSIGFVHGVMNTDNTSISGETIDYGPCAFIDEYDPNACFSSIDAHGRYAYNNQPLIAQWNMACFANCMLPLIDSDSKKATEKAQEVINKFPEDIKLQIMKEFIRKIGLDHSQKASENLLKDLLKIMQLNKADFTLTFQFISDQLESEKLNYQLSLFKDEKEISQWIKRWKELLIKQGKDLNKTKEILKSINPIVIPRNHLIERAIKQGVENEDFSLMDDLMKVFKRPFDKTKEHIKYMSPPEDSEKVNQTFCGT